MELNDLNRLTSVSIPFNTNPSTINTIHDFNVGIYGNSSDIDVFNCSFENISSVGFYNSYGNFNGSAIFSRSLGNVFSSANHCDIGDFNTTSETKSNSFLNTFRSVLLRGNLHSSIIGNHIENNDNIAIEVRNSLPHLEHYMKNNEIINSRYGIKSTLNQGSSVYVEDNNISTYDNGLPNWWGIYISDAASPCIAKVTNNFITSYSSYGILGANNSQSIYQNNTIDMYDANLQPGVNIIIGFQLTNSTGNTVDCNYSGSQYSSNYDSRYSRSFRFYNSPDNFVSCNIATQNWVGFQFHLDCNPTYFYGNSMYDLKDGLLLGDYQNHTASYMGIQAAVGSNSPGNKFFGGDNAGTFGNAATMTVYSYPIINSLWINSGIYAPYPNSTLGGNVIVPYPATGYTPYECIDCGSTGGGGEQGRAEAIVLNGSTPTNFDTEFLKWDSEKKLY